MAVKEILKISLYQTLNLYCGPLFIKVYTRWNIHYTLHNNLTIYVLVDVERILVISYREVSYLKWSISIVNLGGHDVDRLESTVDEGVLINTTLVNEFAYSFW